MSVSKNIKIVEQFLAGNQLYELQTHRRGCCCPKVLSKKTIDVKKMSTWQKLGTCVSLFVSVSMSCLCWSLALAEQLLFSCVSSKVSICNYATCRMSHVTCLMSNTYVDPWDMLNNFSFHGYAQKWIFVIMSHFACHMSYVNSWHMLNNFCFHVYAQKSLFKVENVNAFFFDINVFFWQNFWTAAPSPVSLEFIELVPS